MSEVPPATAPSAPPAAAAPALDAATAPPGSAARWRLLALAALVALWLAPWADVQLPEGGEAVTESWARRTGAVALLALVALWGLAVTALVATTRRGLRIGAAWTDAAVALATTALLLALHAWIPGGDLREAWVPIFGPLAILAALDAVVLAVRRDAGPEVAWLRAGAGLFAAAALAVDLAWLPAGAALWLGATPLALALPRTGPGARRAVEGLLLAASAAALLAPQAQEALAPGAPVVQEHVFTRYGWIVAGLAAGAVAASLLLRGSRPAGASSAA